MRKSWQYDYVICYYKVPSIKVVFEMKIDYKNWIVYKHNITQYKYK